MFTEMRYCGVREALTLTVQQDCLNGLTTQLCVRRYCKSLVNIWLVYGNTIIDMPSIEALQSVYKSRWVGLFLYIGLDANI